MAIVRGESFADALTGSEDADERLVDYLMDLCELVYDRMQELNMTRKDLAGRLGTTPSRVTKILSGESNVTLRTMAELDAALGLDLKISSRAVDAHEARNLVAGSWTKLGTTSDTKGWPAQTTTDALKGTYSLTCFDGGMAA